ncbi:PGPGW domain-containing protein [Isoalcanivorax indicus]|uniref:PGPGW domain-containing protein n=1 Tax=Isoalcanivorax indicus TaxID=2202653 RepID=UPI001FE375ED|nr:PGPGW domain-containing protein [Isoalcanivorax indicus]
MWSSYIEQLEPLLGPWTAWLIGSGLAVGLASMIAVPWLVVRMPADYFLARSKPQLRTGALHSAIWVLRNSLGLLLVLLGIILMFLPGQGLLTVLIGLAISTFPGKYRIERAIIRRRAVYDSINWMRRRAGRPPIIYPDRHGAPATSHPPDQTSP